jgi:hypothetical protein
MIKGSKENEDNFDDGPSAWLQKIKETEKKQ